MHKVLGRRKAYLGILVALGLLLGLMPAGLVHGQVEPLTHGGVDIYIDDVDFVTGTPFTTFIHVDGVVGGGPGTGLFAFNFGVTYSTPAVTFPDAGGSPSCGVTTLNLAFGDPFTLACDIGVGTISVADILFALDGESGDLTMIQLDGTTSCANSSQTLLALTTVQLTDLNGDPLPNQQVTDGEVTCWVAPIASFTSTPDPADAGDTISFTDTSQNMTLLGGAGAQQATWLWDFGDGGTSPLQDPTYSYNVPATYTVCFTTTNPAGTDNVCQLVVVEPGPASTATVSPNPVNINPNASLPFTAVFADSLGNVIPNASMESLVWSTVAGGTIDPVTGVYTAGPIVGDYLDDACVDGTYKAGMVTDCADVLIASTLALTGMFMVQDPVDGVVVIEKWILDTFDVLGNSVPATNGIGGYVNELSYPGSPDPGVDPSLIEVKEIRPGDAPFNSSPTSNIQNDLGTTSLNAVQTIDQLNQAPQLVARVALTLNSCTNQSVTLDDAFTQITDGDGEFILEQAPSAKTFLRGDIKNDGIVDIADVLFGAQYLVGLRDTDPDGGDPDLVHPINMASVKHDGAAGDEKNIADVLFIAQQLVGLRDQCFEVV